MRIVLLLFFLIFSYTSYSQSSLFLKNGAIVTVSKNATLTIIGDVEAFDTGDTSNISPLGLIKIKGDWNNNGTGKLVDKSDGIIEFNGTAKQGITGNNAFYNLEINNLSGVSIASGNTILNNELTLTLGNFATGNSFTLRSTASKTARIAPILSGSISGDVTIQAFIENTGYDYRFLSMPVKSKTLNEWSDDFLMTGFIGTPYPAFNFVSVYYYDETEPGDKNARYDSATNVTNPVPMGIGVQAYLGATDVIVDVTGEIYSGGINFPVTFTDDLTQLIDQDGWNLLGNPYPSTIDWNSGAWTKLNINDAIYIYAGSQAAFQSYVNGVGANGGTQYIPSSQSFWVKAIGAPILISTENVKTNQEIGFIENNQEVLRLSLSNQTYSDEVVVRFNEEASPKFDNSWDAYKFRTNSSNPQLIAIQDLIEYSILSSSTDSLNVPIYFKMEVPISGNYSINVGSFPKNVSCLILEDLFTGRIENLRDSSSFNFYLSDTTNSPRFRLFASKIANFYTKNALCFGDSSELIINPNLNSLINLSWKQSLGSVTLLDSIQQLKSYKFANGIYHFETTNSNCAVQYDTIAIESPNEINTITYSLKDSGFATGKAWVNLRGGIAPYFIEWQTKPIQIGDTARNLNAGVYKLKIEDSNSCIKLDSIDVKGLITNIEELDLLRIEAFPNPFKEIITLSGIEALLDFKLFDIEGRVLKIGTLSKIQPTINVSHLGSGVYFLHLKNAEIILTLKIKKI